MTWALAVSPEFEQDYRKLCGKNAGLRRAVDKKVSQIRENPTHFKPLRTPLQGVRRVHLAGSYVLLFEPDVERRMVKLIRLAHHDVAYGF